MREKLNISQEQKLQQRLSPLQVQYVQMLEMNRIEVEEAVRHELDENPALEVAEPTVAEANVNKDDEGEEFTESAEDMQLADYRDEDDIPYYRTNISNYSPDDAVPETVIVSENSLFDYLEEQIGERDLDESQLIIAQYIIGNIDDNGYLQRTPSAICDDITFQTGLEVPLSEVKEILNIVRELDPAGVGAIDLKDCLMLQLNRLPDSDNKSRAVCILDLHFDEFQKKHYDKIASALGLSRDMTTEVIDLICSLNPKPGSLISGSSHDDLSQQILPDFSIEIDGQQLTITLLNNIPDLQIEESFSIMNESYSPGKKLSRSEEEAATFVKQKYDSASNFIKLLKQRQDTLFSVFKAIVNRQRDFFLSGEEYDLRPMVLKDISEDTGHDVSVISRATAGKYVLTQWGIFPLKYFFNEGLQHQSGEEVSSREIQSILKSVIAEENKKKPYSDEQLCAIMKKHGYEIARRTIAKYRLKLSIPVARLRKEL